MVSKSRESPYSWLLAPQAPPSSRSPPIRSIHSDSTFESRLKLAIHREGPTTHSPHSPQWVLTRVHRARLPSGSERSMDDGGIRTIVHQG